MLGLFLFSHGSYESFRWNRQYHPTGRYFYWLTMPLDRDPLNLHPTSAKPCKADRGDCTEVDLDFWIFEPSWQTQTFIFSALPAFLFGGVLASAFGHFGISQVITFMAVLPPLIVAWYYFLGWIIDRLIDRVRRRVHAPC